MPQLEITVQELAAKLKSPSPPRLVDVRQPEEFALTAIEGSLLIPLGELSARLNELPEGELVIYCHHGMRSLRAAAVLAAQGRQALSLRGGIDAWAAQVDPNLPRY